MNIKRISIIAIWLLAYVGSMAYVTGRMLDLRQEVLEQSKDPQDRAEWQGFKDKLNEKDNLKGKKEHQKIQRSDRKTADPPLTIVMRDRFPAMMAGALGSVTVLFLLLGFALKGALTRAPHPPEPPSDS